MDHEILFSATRLNIYTFLIGRLFYFAFSAFREIVCAICSSLCRERGQTDETHVGEGQQNAA
jgi:hypothetical protein